MNGAESLVRTWSRRVDVCFANPAPPRCISSPRSTVEACAACSPVRGRGDGAADGYFRMKARRRPRCCISVRPRNGWPTCTTPRRPIPASSTSSPACGLSHRLQRAADFRHRGLARPMSAWVRTSPDAKSVAKDGAAAIAAARASAADRTLILPADTPGTSRRHRRVPAESQRASYSSQAVDNAAKCCAAARRRCCCSPQRLTEQGWPGAQISARPAAVMGQTIIRAWRGKVGSRSTIPM